MLGVPDTNIIEIPSNLTTGEVMDALRDGHDYIWRVMVSEPKLIAWGTVSHGNLPEIILVGRRLMLTDTVGDANRLRNLLEVLARRRA